MFLLTHRRIGRINNKLVLCLLLCISSPLICATGHASSSLSLTSQDRILILAPHPDDEAIGTGGIIQKAVALGIPFKVVYLTNGDNNELAFLVYKKYPVLGRVGLLKMGEIRRQEAMAAMKFLGLQESQMIFLGYPDFGTTEIFTKYWGDTKPFRSLLTRVNSVPYKDAFSYGAAYKGENILNDIKKILVEFGPTKIFVTLPADTNRDHRAWYLFLKIALWDLAGQIPPPQVYQYLIHAAGWPMPRGFHPELSLGPPAKLSHLDWNAVELTPDEIEKKKQAIEYYKSQNAYNPSYLYTFARKNELFGGFADIVLKENQDTIEWEKHEFGQKITGHLTEEQHEHMIGSVAYARQDQNLLVRIAPAHWESKLSGMNLFLIGYKNGKSFPDMPKIRINIDFDKFVSVYDGLKHVSIKGMKFSQGPDFLLIEFPLSALGDPDFILSSAKTYMADWPIETTEWRSIVIDGNSD